MTSSHRAPKQWSLTKEETVNSFENWKQNLLYTLMLDSKFAPFLVSGVTWEVKYKNSPHRGFVDDVGDGGVTKEQKVATLELMLGQIANYCPVISRNSIVKSSTSIDQIWQSIRLHFGFQTTGAHLIDFSSIRLEPGKRPEDLYQRLVAFVDDNLLRQGMGISHHGRSLDEDEELSPTLENLVVLTWLRLIHPALPKLVKQRYGTELRPRTLAWIKPEISQALSSLLEELQASDDAKVMRAAVSRFPNQSRKTSYERSTRSNNTRPTKVCCLCKTAGRPDNHFLSKCAFLPIEDRHYLVKARQITGISDVNSDDELDTVSEINDHSQPVATGNPSANINRVRVAQSPYIDAFNAHHPIRLTVDSGATGNMIRASVAKDLNLRVTCSSQSASQADGSSSLTIVGETRTVFTHDNHKLHLDALVVENLGTDILAGIPFMEQNDISIRPAKRQVLIGDTVLCSYGSIPNPGDRHAIRRVHVLRAPERSTIWPGQFLEMDIPNDLSSQCPVVSIEPHDSQSAKWPPPSLLTCVSGKVRIPNLTQEPQFLKRSEHFCKVRATYIPEAESIGEQYTNPCKQLDSNHSKTVTVDPDNILPEDTRQGFSNILHKYDSVFDSNFSGYNGAVGPFEAKVNMGPVLPPQRKGRLPQYGKSQLNDLQDKFDELEQLGVFRKPEDVNVSVEYLNPSFLVKKPNGGFRLVTAFADVGRYSKPQPSLMPDVDSTLRQIAQWKFLAVTDLTKAFYQIPLSKDSMKFCGVVTPFRGVRVYARSAMGMPGSETSLEELTCRVLGDLIQEGIVAKLADDLYCGGNTPDELLKNFERVLRALQQNSLNLSASKTTIAPRQTNILGWVWRSGSLQAQPHRVATLLTCSAPPTVSALRSFIGAYKVLSRVIKNSASFIAPLDDVVAGRDSRDKIQWTDGLHEAFSATQDALLSNRSIVLPQPSDTLWIVTDGASKNHG